MLTENNQKILAQMPQKYHRLFEIFFEIAEVPRGSGNRGPITAHLKKWAEEHKFSVSVDETSNLLIKVPATAGCEHAPLICLQAHTDKVDVKDPAVEHDFKKDPLVLRIHNEFLMATGTTLGADDGMGLAIAMYCAEANKHGPLELLFTSDEEIGLIGATALKKCLEAKYLLNLDSEDYGEICVSCAGGFRVDISKKFTQEKIPEDFKVFELNVHSYLGGHSGAEIHKFRANAIKQVAKVAQLISKKCELRLVSINGGTAHNAIPAFCKAVVAVKPLENCQQPDKGCLMEKLQQCFAKITKCFAEEKEAKLEVAKVAATESFTTEETKEILAMISALPHGPQRISQSVKDFVETSFAATVIKTEGNQISILGSGRSCYEEELDMLYVQLCSICSLPKWNISEQQSRYPGWPANMDSPLLKITEQEYKKLYPNVKVTAIHAGLEAGLITKVHPGLDAISIGPTILSPHSPSERCEISTVGPSYEIVYNMLIEFCKQ